MKRDSWIFAACALALAGVAVSAPAAPAQRMPALTAQPRDMRDVQLSFAPVVKRIAPAVVNVYSRSVVQAPVNPFFNDPFFQRFFGLNPQMQKRV